MAYNPARSFEQWATGYEGMDGGNVKAQLWFCGIEYGGQIDDASKINFEQNAPDEWREWHTVDDFLLPYVAPLKDPSKPSQTNLKISKPYAIGLSKIASGFYEKPITDWMDFTGKDGCSFTMNLYPLSFRSHDDALWDARYFHKTGFLTKAEYKVWCINNRFPNLKKLVNRFTPACLICLGLSLKDQFLIAFCDDSEQLFEQPAIEKISDGSKARDIYYRTINNGKTLLMICPFVTGAYGLNSDNLLKGVADFAKGACKKFGIL